MCGNGRVDAAEECDDGNADETDACKSDCRAASCGDGVVRGGVEACDDGNGLSGDGCDANCTPTACGNGVVTSGEGCDDGNPTDGDGCDSNCTPTACGNGIATAPLEACDDGNTANGDGCSAACTLNGEPNCAAASAAPAVVWPPNHTFTAVTITGVVDPDGDALTFEALGIRQDEPVAEAGAGAGATEPDATLSPIAIRAERNGTVRSPGNGRVYAIRFVASDGRGGSCTGAVTVCVPHDQNRRACVDDGAGYDSLVP